MRVRGRGFIGSVTAALVAAGALAMAPTSSAALRPVAPPPASSDLVAATNAMLSFDLAGVLSAGAGDDASFRTGFMNPPGGQDPLPVCQYSSAGRGVPVPDTMAVGYTAMNGFVEQSVYQYLSAEAAGRAWTRLSTAIGAHCSGSWTNDDYAWRVSRKRLRAVGAAGAGWAVTTTSNVNVQHTAVIPVGDAIQVTSYVRQSPTLVSGVPAAINALSRRLADRWAQRATAPTTQGPLVTGAETSMLMTTDVPAQLPVTTSANGGWSTFTASAPGDSPWTCAARVNLPAGSWTFSSFLGGSGGVLAEPGQLGQTMNVFQTDDAASAVWNKLRRAVLTCNDSSWQPISSTKPISRNASGVSAFRFDGRAAVWSRNFATDPGAGFSMKSYTVHVISGNAIQSVTYSLTRDEIADLPLDQLAVNMLAEQLMLRWNDVQAALAT